MDQNDCYEIYESLINETAAIPERSKLYSLEPLGISTLFIESLSSYIIRLAKIHNVSTIDLLRNEICNYLESEYLTKEIQDGGLNEKCKYVNGASSLAIKFIKATEYLTKIPLLENLTLLPIITYGISTKGLLREHKVWCPLCYHEQIRKHNITYDHLIWNIEVVTTCPKHNIRLVDSCLNCKKKFMVLHNGSVAANLCYNCGFDLSKCEVEYSSNKWEHFVNTNISYMISSSSPIRTNNFVENLLSLKNERGMLQSISRVSSISHGTFRDWIMMKQKPTLNYIFRFCYSIGITVQEVVFGKIDINNLSIKDKSIIGDFEDKWYKTRSILSRSEVIEQLVEIISEDVFPPPSLREVATVLKKDHRNLNRDFKKLSKIIVRRREKYIKWSNEQRIKKTYNRVKSAAIDLYKKGLYPSADLIAENLNDKSIFIKPEAVQARNDFLKENKIVRRTNQYS